MLGQKAVFRNAFLALNPAGDGHGVLFQNLRRNEPGTFPLCQPAPCFLVHLHGQQVFSVFLFGREKRLGRRHLLALQIGGAVGEIQHGQLALAGIAVGNIVRQRLFLAASADARAALSVCHDFTSLAGLDIPFLKSRKFTQRGGPAMWRPSF